MEILARLNPKHQQYDSVSPGTGGDAVTGLDVAAALSMAKLTPLAEEYARARYALDEQAREMLHAMLANIIKRRYRQTSGPKITDPQAESLAYLVITRNVDTRRCRKCNGTGYNREQKECRTCRGSGVYTASAAQNARVIGVSPQAYGQSWAKRVADMDTLVAELDRQVKSGVRRALFGRAGDE
jgi:hypothetical protein